MLHVRNIHDLQTMYIRLAPKGFREKAINSLYVGAEHDNRILLQLAYVVYIVNTETKERIFFWNFYPRSIFPEEEFDVFMSC